MDSDDVFMMKQEAAKGLRRAVAATFAT